MTGVVWAAPAVAVEAVVGWLESARVEAAQRYAAALVAARLREAPMAAVVAESTLAGATVAALLTGAPMAEERLHHP